MSGVYTTFRFFIRSYGGRLLRDGPKRKKKTHTQTEKEKKKRVGPVGTKRNNIVYTTVYLRSDLDG